MWLTLIDCWSNAVFSVYFYITALELKRNRVGWALSVIVFLQSLWALVSTSHDVIDDYDLPRVVAVYVFGSVGCCVTELCCSDD
ncbi:hypothetical protein cypCar_00044633 [Cyprinus carpio]|nr:hypothetical protein cypCar_00044633 [Cyprinus carpio]